MYVGAIRIFQGPDPSRPPVPRGSPLLTNAHPIAARTSTVAELRLRDDYYRPSQPEKSTRFQQNFARASVWPFRVCNSPPRSAPTPPNRHLLIHRARQPRGKNSPPSARRLSLGTPAMHIRTEAHALSLLASTKAMLQTRLSLSHTYRAAQPNTLLLSA